jgi:glycosyltransferase involved in cell wall biosynthesis
MGGASTRVSNAIKGLRGRGHDIFVVTAFPHYPKGNIPLEYRNRAFVVEGDSHVRVFRVWVPALPHEGAKRLVMYVSFTLFSLLSLPFSGKVDVVWALSPNYFSAISGFFYKMLKRVPLVLDVVDLWPEALVSLGVLTSKFLVGLVDAGLMFFYGISDSIITLNEGMRKQILNKVEGANKVFIVGNAVDLAVFKPQKVERLPELRGKFVVMYSGNLGQMYDFDTVLDSAKLLSSHPEIIFVIRGTGERLQELKLKVACLPNVLIYDQIVSVERISEFLNMADVLLLPLKKLKNPETVYPIKLLEYIACEKPVIHCGEGETKRMLSRNKFGLTVEPGDSVSLSRTILNLSDYKEQYSLLRMQGRRFICRNFSIAEMARRLATIFKVQSAIYDVSFDSLLTDNPSQNTQKVQLRNVAC